MSGFDSALSAWLDPDNRLLACPECGGQVVDLEDGRFVCLFDDCDWTSDE